MKSLNRSLVFFLLACLVVVGLTSCGGSVPKNIDPLNITTRQVTGGVINKAYSASFTASGGLPPFTWSVSSGSLPDGVNLNSDGTLTGTPTKLGTYNFTVQVKDSQTPTAAMNTASYGVTINDVLAISTTSLDDGSKGSPYQAALNATGGVPPYTWTITSGALPDGLQLQRNTIFGTPTKEGTFNFTAQVADAENPQVTLSVNLSISVYGAIGRLSGHFAFGMRGFDKDGKLVLIAGSFIGNPATNPASITSGVIDVNTGSGPLTNLKITGGTYTLAYDHDDGTGTTAARGSMTLNVDTLGPLTFQVAASPLGYIASILDAKDSNGNYNALNGAYGEAALQKQSVSAFNGTNNTQALTNLQGTWVFGESGNDSVGARFASVGSFKLDDKGAMTSVNRDSNDNGTVSQNQSLAGSITAPDTTTGRGTGTIGFGSTGNSEAFSYYVISAGELVAVSATAPGVGITHAIYSIIKQASAGSGFTNANLNGSSLLAFTANVNGAANAAVGQVVWDGKGNISGHTIDENTGGTLKQDTGTGTYSVDASGRVTITGIGGANSIAYLISFNGGFYLGTDATVQFGDFGGQNPNPQNKGSFVAGDLNGPYAGGSVDPVVPGVIDEIDSATFDGKSAFTLIYDTSSSSGEISDLNLAGSYAVDTTGRVKLTDSNSNPIYGVGWLLGPSKLVVVTNETNPKLVVVDK